MCNSLLFTRIWNLTFSFQKKSRPKKLEKLWGEKNTLFGPSLWRNGCRSYQWPNPYLRQCAIAYRSPRRSPRRWRRKTRQSKWSPSSVGWRKQPTNDTRASRREPREPLSDVCVRFAAILTKNPTSEHILPERNPDGFWLVFGVIWKKRTKKESDDSLTFFSHLPLVELVCHTLLYELANGDDKSYAILALY